MNTLLLVSLHYAEYSFELAKSLALHQPTVLVLSRYSLLGELSPLKLPAVANLRIHVVPGNRDLAGFCQSCLIILILICKLKPRVVHFQEVFNELQVFAILCSLAFGCKPALTVHDPIPHSGDDIKTFRNKLRPRLFYRWLQRRFARGFIVHSEFMVYDLRDFVGSSRHIVVAPHGPLGLLLQGCQRKYDICASEFRVLMFGYMVKFKGLDLFIQAIESLRLQGLPVVGVIAGHGDELDRLESKVLDNDGFEVLNYFLPPMDVADVFDHASVLVLPYREATQSGVAAYGIGRGIPIIATKVGGLPDMVIDQVTGLLIPPDDPHSLAQAIAKLYHNPNACNQMANATVRFGMEVISWERASNKTLELYEHIS